MSLPKTVDEIQGESPASALTGVETFLVGQGNSTKGATSAQIKTFVLANSSINVKDAPYNAKGDGVTDDIPKEQAAVNSFGNTAANSAGGIFYPRSTYAHGGTLTFNGQTGFKIEGEGKFLSILQAIPAAAGLPMIYFDRGAYCSVKEMSIYAQSSGSQIGSAIEAKMTANSGPTPQGMIYENLYIDGKQTGGFSCGIRFTAAGGQDNNNERAFLKNCDFANCGTGISIEHYNSLLHQIYGGVIGSCGVGISTANGLGGSFSATGVSFIQNSIADIDIGDNSTHSIDIVNCKSEATTGLWIRALITTGRTDINVINSTFHGIVNNSFVDYRSTGKVVLQGCQMQVTGSTRKISMTNAASVLILIGNYMDIDSIESAGKVFMIGNKYAGGTPTLTVLGGTGKFFVMDDPSVIKFPGTLQPTSAGGYLSSDTSAGISTTVTTAGLVGKTITVKDGIITGFA